MEGEKLSSNNSWNYDFWRETLGDKVVDAAKENDEKMEALRKERIQKYGLPEDASWSEINKIEDEERKRIEEESERVYGTSDLDEILEKVRKDAAKKHGLPEDTPREEILRVFEERKEKS